MSEQDLAIIDEWTVIEAGLTQLGFRRVGRAGEQSIQQSSLADAVAAHESDLLSSQHAGGEVADDLVVTISLGDTFDFQHVLAGRALLFELKEGARNV